MKHHRPRIGLALGSGSARGWSHIGVIRVLERAGWTFWRCFASTFVRRRQTVLDDLARTLNALDIQPVAPATGEAPAWSVLRRVKVAATR